MTTHSTTGRGCWVYSKPAWKAIPTPPPDQELDDETCPPWVTDSKISQGEPPRPSTPIQIEPREGSNAYLTPKSSPPPSPSAPKPLTRTYSTGVLADMDMKFLLHIRKDEDIGNAVQRHVELYMRESSTRKRENQRRVYEFVKTRPHLLHETGEDTELFMRGNSKWDSDPFL
ncbi:hypothetical protein P691DRAFT_800522 [Macrolepiota fuliginosa MF-IS2]|uniref:Uncharacterized protein n=1 Tax=Macrolepiota fuliginosa MF-IS2 TaxID=1400762 RepID=A0A9P5XF11_9AGAR|nr:hypothetical protein P691DRAFT_800522 [Macrolepiota fuliginosa MF-IS2]